MEIEDLKQAPFNTTLLGVLRGVVDHYGIEAPDGTLFGGSGHAFMINIHEALCPSGPYCWRRECFARLSLNLGIEVIDHGFFRSDTPKPARERVEAQLKADLDAGRPCSLMNMENQLITGYDETGFTTAQPWAPHSDFPPDHLTFGSWSEFGEECHVNFYTYEKRRPASRAKVAVDSLAYALDILQDSKSHTDPPYAAGLGAYAQWIRAVEAGHGTGHGCWWNGVVWAECRTMASAFCREIAADFPAVSNVASETAERYGRVADLLEKVSDKQMAAEEKPPLLRTASEEERKCGPALAEMLNRLESV